MNLELNGHTITLGPKALAFIETNMRGMGEVYCRDQLELWRAGGKCDPDVTVIGPARFVAKGNAIGIPMMPKAGVVPASVAESKTGSKEPLPVASAAPAEDNTVLRVAPNGIAIEPYGTLPVKGDSVFACFDDGTPAPDGYGVPDVVVGGIDGKADTASGHTFKLRWFKRPHDLNGVRNYVCRRATKVANELERQAHPVTGLQVYRQDDGNLNIARYDAKGSLVLATRVGGRWHKERTDGPDEYVFATLVVGPEADAAIKEAREQGVLS